MAWLQMGHLNGKPFHYLILAVKCDQYTAKGQKKRSRSLLKVGKEIKFNRKEERVFECHLKLKRVKNYINGFSLPHLLH